MDSKCIVLGKINHSNHIYIPKSKLLDTKPKNYAFYLETKATPISMHREL